VLAKPGRSPACSHVYQCPHSHPVLTARRATTTRGGSGCEEAIADGFEALPPITVSLFPPGRAARRDCDMASLMVLVTATACSVVTLEQATPRHITQMGDDARSGLFQAARNEGTRCRLDRCRVPGSEEVSADGDVELLHAVEALLLPVRQVLGEPLDLRLRQSGGGHVREARLTALTDKLAPPRGVRAGGAVAIWGCRPAAH
jgi:hypothetical protein